MALGDRRRGANTAIPLRLQITSMMDMFTIILIFLLFSFSTEPDIPQLERELRLPQSSADLTYNEGLKLVLTQNRLLLGDEIIVLVEDGKILDFNPLKPEESELYTRLKYFLKKAERMSESEIKNRPIHFLCDKRLPFQTINHVVKAAAGAGYPNFKFTVLQKS